MPPVLWGILVLHEKTQAPWKEAFRVSATVSQKAPGRKHRNGRQTRKREMRRKRQAARQARVARRLKHREDDVREAPVMGARNIDYELATRTQAVGAGGIGAMHLLSRKVGLVDAIDARLHLLKIHKPYHESDHVLNLAYNALCGGHRLDDLEQRRCDEAYLNGLGADRVPDPTTAGDFCRRFQETDVKELLEAINESRVQVWRQQPSEFFGEAVLDVDGAKVETTGECKQGMDISHDGKWGYQAQIVSLANTGEVLYVSNHPASRPSHEGAARYLDRAASLCSEAGFRRVRMRGDTDFTQTPELDAWDEQGHVFNFGMDAMPNLKDMAEILPEEAWSPLERPPRYKVKTTPRARPENVKEQVIRDREFTNLRLKEEQVAETTYQPTACRKPYRLVIVRKRIERQESQLDLFEEIRYHFYLTNDPTMSSEEVVFDANDRCDQENLIAQLKGGVRALQAPVDNLVSNWAYMVMTSLAWTLKAWFALTLPEWPRWREKHQAEKRSILRMEFRTFCNWFMNVPAQVVRAGRRVIYRLLGWNPWQDVFLRAVEALRAPMRC